MQDRSARGFTLTELLVTVAIIGVVMTVAIPTLIGAMDRGRQKRTMTILRDVGTAIASYSVDQNLYPQTTDVAALAAILQSEGYLEMVPTADAWGNGLIYEGAALDYTLGSAGKDGGTTLSLVGAGGPTRTFDADIVFTRGVFVQWPEGLQE